MREIFELVNEYPWTTFLLVIGIGLVEIAVSGALCALGAFTGQTKLIDFGYKKSDAYNYGTAALNIFKDIEEAIETVSVAEANNFSNVAERKKLSREER